MMQGISQAFGRHGGRLDEAMRAWPDAARPWLDLSTGINPVPWAPPVGLTVDPSPLPGRDALAALEAAAAAYLGTDPAQVAAVPGSEIALRLLPVLGLPRPIVALRPGYGTHADVADALAEAFDAGCGGTMLLANPNNPDGRRHDPDRIRARAAGGSWTVVDEAFADATPDASLCQALTGEEPIVVLRSFGKFFGLAGVRLGFVVAPPAIVARVRALLGDWPVGAHAIAWGRAAYADKAWIAATRAWLTRQAAALDAVLAGHGLAARGDCPLFRLVEHDEARAVFARLAAKSILTRPFEARADWLRLGLPADDDGLDRLDRALADG